MGPLGKKGAVLATHSACYPSARVICRELSKQAGSETKEDLGATALGEL